MFKQPAIEFNAWPHRLSGVVVGCLLNHAPALAALGTAVDQPPYKGAPRAPVLYVKPRNTLTGEGAQVAVPAGFDEVEIGAALGLVMARTACRVAPGDALAHVAGAMIAADLSLPHDSFYRPSVRLKARDGFCPLGSQVVPLDQLGPPDDLAVRVFVDGRLVHACRTDQRIRSAANLLSQVSDFMTLQPGDVLMTGVAFGAPRAGAGQQVAIEIDGLGRLDFTLVADRPGRAA